MSAVSRQSADRLSEGSNPAHGRGDDTMKTAMVVTAVAVALAFTGGVAMASSCPKVIKEGRDAAAKMKADDPKVKAAVAKLNEAQKLHDGGKHTESLAKANEALADLKK
jgi:hypothetical protein